jgi:hypothetical protein
LFFTNTIIAGHSHVGITVTAGSTATLEGTLWYNNGMDMGGEGKVLTGTVNVENDPAFVNPTAWNYHLGAGSAAIDAGVDAGITADIDGDPRPQGPGYDIGADEVVTSGSPTYTLTVHTVGQGIVSHEPMGTVLLPSSAIFEAGTHVTLTARPDSGWRFIDWSGHLDSMVNPARIVMDVDKTITATFARSVINQAPTAIASAIPSTLHSGRVTLDASGSHDPDGDVLTYRWTQSSGPPVTLSDAATVSATFGAPTQASVLTFILTVTDTYNARDRDTVAVTIINQAPQAVASADPSTLHSGRVTLDGGGSQDPDGDALTYHWAQRGGTPVMLSNAAAIRSTFIAPSTPGVLTFTLTVTDPFDLHDSAITTVTVESYRIYLPTVLRND